MKYVYVLLTRTGTLPAKMIHIFTGGSFTHASISLMPRTDTFYSYGRRKLNNPFIAGLIQENIHTFVFAKYPNCNSAVFAIPVSEDAYLRLQHAIDHYMANYDRCRYNFLGLLSTRIGIRIRRRYRFTCSQFVAILLFQTKATSLPKDPFLMMPNDFSKIPGAKLVYSGKLHNCRIPSLISEAPSV